MIGWIHLRVRNKSWGSTAIQKELWEFQIPERLFLIWNSFILLSQWVKSWVSESYWYRVVLKDVHLYQISQSTWRVRKNIVFEKKWFGKYCCPVRWKPTFSWKSFQYGEKLSFLAHQFGIISIFVAMLQNWIYYFLMHTLRSNRGAFLQPRTIQEHSNFIL